VTVTVTVTVIFFTDTGLYAKAIQARPNFAKGIARCVLGLTSGHCTLCTKGIARCVSGLTFACITFARKISVVVFAF